MTFSNAIITICQSVQKRIKKNNNFIEIAVFSISAWQNGVVVIIIIVTVHILYMLHCLRHICAHCVLFVSCHTWFVVENVNSYTKRRIFLLHSSFIVMILIWNRVDQSSRLFAPHCIRQLYVLGDSVSFFSVFWTRTHNTQCVKWQW